MKPPKKVILPKDREAERSINQMFTDLYRRVAHDAPAEKASWLALSTTDEKLTFLAQKLGLI